MTTTIYGVWLPKAITEVFPVADKEKLEVKVEGDKLILTRAGGEREQHSHKSLEEYLAECGWDGRSYEPEKVEWGTVGGEVECFTVNS